MDLNGNIPSFLTRTNTRARSDPREDPVMRSAGCAIADRKGLDGSGFQIGGDLSMPGLGGRPVSIPSFLSSASAFSTIGNHQKPVYRNLALPASFSLEGAEGADLFRSADVDPAVKPRPLPPVFEKTTSFSCNRPAEEIFKAVGAALSEFDVEPVPEKAKFKGCASLNGQLLTFQVHIFAKPDGSHLVEFQRRRGDSCSFWFLFQDVMSSLGNDLADAAAFTRSVPQICKKRRAFAKSSAPVKYSTKTVDHLCDMATSSVCDGRVEALQSILDAIEHGCPASKSSSGKLTSIALKACGSKDARVSTCAKTIVTKLFAKSDVDSNVNKKKSADSFNAQVLNLMAKKALTSIQKSSGFVNTKHRNGVARGGDTLPACMFDNASASSTPPVNSM